MDTPTVSTPHDPLPHIWELGTISLMNGSPGAGKTALLAAILQRLSQGGNLLGFDVRPTPVFYIVMDRPWATGANRWFERYGFDIPHYSFVDDRSLPAKYFHNQAPWESYINMLEALGQPAGTFFNTDTLENAYGNVMDRKQVITASTALHRYFMDKQYAQNGMMHSTKMKGDAGENYANVHEQMAGTGALSGYSSTQITVLSPKQAKSKKCELHITSHSLPGMVWELERDKNGCFRVDDAQPRGDIELDENGKAVDAVLSLIPAAPLLTRRKDLIKALTGHYTVSSIDQALRHLLTEMVILSPNRGEYQKASAH